MTDKERKDYVLGTYLKCTKPITNIRKGEKSMSCLKKNNVEN